MQEGEKTSTQVNVPGVDITMTGGFEGAKSPDVNVPGGVSGSQNISIDEKITIDVSEGGIKSEIKELKDAVTSCEETYIVFSKTGDNINAVINDGYRIEFPEYITVKSENANWTGENNVLTLNNPDGLEITENTKVKFQITKVDFEKDGVSFEYADNDQSKITLGGAITLDGDITAKSISSTGGIVSIGVNVESTNMSIVSVTGKVDPAVDINVDPITLEDIPEFLSNIVGMFPIVRDMYSIIEGYDITNSAYTGLTNITNAGKNMWKLAELLISGRQYDSAEIASIIRQTANGLTQTFGIPLRNAEKYVKSIVDMFSPETAYKWNSMFKTRGMSAYYEALGKAQNNESLQTTIFKTMLRDKGVGVDSTDVSNEFLRLYNAGVNALPQSVATTLTYNDEKIELTQLQYKQVQNSYNKASTQAQKLIASKEYKNANDTVKGKALKSLYDYYYEQAIASITNEELDKFGMFAQGFDVYKLAMYTAEISNIRKEYNEAKSNGSTKSSLKDLIVDYVADINLTAVQKYMLLGYAGYKNANGSTQVQSYINTLPLTKEQKQALITYCGY